VFLVPTWITGPGHAAEEDADPRERIRTVARATWAGPQLESALAGLEAQAAAAREEAHPGAFYTEIQREGISQFFNEAANASWFLRLGSPFNAPWYGGAIRASVKANEKYVAAMRRVAALQTAGSAVEAWLELAAADSRLSVRQGQLQRLEWALELQRKRLELGEVSGAEVKQLELERLRLVGEVSAHRADRADAAESLGRLAGPEVPGPRLDDLRLLHNGFPPLDLFERETDDWLETSPSLIAGALDAERVRLEGERARRTVWGRPEAEVTWEHIPTVDDTDGFDSVGFRLRVPLPVGGLGKRQAAVSAARQRRAESDQEAARRETAARIRAEMERARTAGEMLVLLGDIEAELAVVEHSLSERYRLGAVAYLEYLDGLSRLDEVRVQTIDARLGGARARLELAVLTGNLDFFPLPEPGGDLDTDQETD
jgi:outer membrane protein TolC